MFFAVFVFQVFRPLKVLQKFWKNYIKNQRPGSLRKHTGRKGGPPQRLKKGPWRGPTLGRVGHPPGCPVAPLGAPFGLYLVPTEETPNIDLLFQFSSLYHRRCRFKIGAARRSFPGTLSEGGTTSGRPSIAMDASRMCREYSPLDHGSVTSSYVMCSSPLCASTFETSSAASHDRGTFVIFCV